MLSANELVGLFDELEKIGGIGGYFARKLSRNLPIVVSVHRRAEEFPERFRKYRRAIEENIPASEVEFEG